MINNVTINESTNPKQLLFLKKVLKETTQKREGYKYFFYGGAIRGGKTFISLTILVLLAKMFPNSRWHIIRNTLANLKATTIPSMEKILYGSNSVKWHRNASDYYIEFENNSRIYFFAEQIDKDPDLARFKGLETNGILLEQIEELALKTWEKAKERVGSWKIPQLPLDQNPPPYILSTFNPTNTWLKTEIYDKHERGELEKPYFYLSALPTDNAYNEAHQYETWATLDSRNYDRFIKGSWDYEDDKLRFAYSFDIDRHVTQLSYDKNEGIFLSFDFGKVPNVCLVIQSDLKTNINVIEEFASKGEKGLLELLADLIFWLEKNNIDKVYITGDASGETFSQYAFIRSALYKANIEIKQIKKGNANPNINSNRILLNSVLQNFESVKVGTNCKNLIRDLLYTEVLLSEETGKLSIVKSGKNSSIDKNNEVLSHNLDAFRYFIWNYFKWFLKFGDI